MASDLKPILNGQTGTVTHMAHHQGKMSSKSLEVCFTRDVVVLPDSQPTPISLLVCIGVGDSLHYNAELVTDPISNQLTYMATKVWLPNTKSKMGKEPPLSQSPTVPDQFTPKKLRKLIRKLLENQGFLTVEQLHSELGLNSAEWHKVYGYTVEGLRAFVDFHKMYYIISDGQVSLLKGGKTLVQKCILAIKRLLQPLESASVHELYNLFQNCDEDLRRFIFSNKALYSFLESHSEDFLLMKDGTVFPIERNRGKSANKSSTSDEPSKNVPDDPILGNVKHCLESILKDKEQMPLYKLFEELKESAPDTFQMVGTKPTDLLKVLGQFPGTFVVQPNQMVKLLKPASCDNQGGTHQKGGKFPKAMKETADNGLTKKSFAFIKSVLVAKGPIKIDQLTAEIVAGSPDVSEHIGGTRDAVAAFLNTNKVFRISDDGTVLHGKPKKNSTNPGKQSSMLRHYSGPIQSVGPQFGFIHHGLDAADNIFFDAQSYMKPIGDLKSILSPGDRLDCLYYCVLPGKRNKYRAVDVWKAPAGDDDRNSFETELIPLPTMLTSPMCYGEAKVTYLAGDLGYCCLDVGDTDSLIKLEDQNEPTLITFHLGHMQRGHELRKQIKKGASVMFLALQCPTARDSIYPVHWRAIDLFPSLNRSETVNSKDLHSITAEVQELTTEGGRLSFGNNTWADSITFHWNEILSNADGLLNRSVCVSVGDAFWCIVARGQIPKDSDKWVAIELFPCKLDMTSSPPSKYLSCPEISLQSHELHIGNHLPNPRDPRNNLCRSNSTESSREDGGTRNNCDNKETLESRKSDVILQKTPSPDHSLQSGFKGDKDFLLYLEPLVGKNDASAGHVRIPEAVAPIIEDGIGKMVSKDNYGGILETESGDVLKFTAHAFYYNGRPVSHLAFPISTQVHFDGHCMENGEMYAPIIWIGRRPTLGKETSLPQ